VKQKEVIIQRKGVKEVCTRTSPLPSQEGTTQTFQAVLPGSQDQILDLAVLYMPNSLDIRTLNPFVYTLR